MMNKQQITGMWMVIALLIVGCVAEDSQTIDVELTPNTSGCEGGCGEQEPVAMERAEESTGERDEEQPEPEPFADVQVAREPEQIDLEPLHISPEPTQHTLGEVTCEADAHAEWSLELVHISGRLTVNGAHRLDADFGRALDGRIVFTDSLTGKRYSAPLETDGDGETYDITLYAGRYDVVLETIDSGQDCSWGCPLATLAERFDISETSAADFDVALTTLTGALTLDGETVPDVSDGTRGRVRFIDRVAGAGFAAPIPATGEVSFEVTLVQGTTYDVYWQTGEISVTNPELSDIPRGVAELGAVTVGGEPDHMEFDAETIEVSGELTIDGAALPDDGIRDGISRASLFFGRNDELEFAYGLGHKITLDEEGAATFRTRLFPGNNQVWFRGNHQNHQDVFMHYAEAVVCGAPPMPDCGFSGGQDLAVQFDVVGRHILTAQGGGSGRTAVSGRVVWWGEPYSSGEDTNDVGRVIFYGQDNAERVQRLVDTSGGFSLTLSPGTYDVYLVGRKPSGYTTLAQGFVVGASPQEVTFRARIVRVRGEVLINGMTAPDNMVGGWDDSRGHLRLRGLRPNTQDEFIRMNSDLGHEGPARFERVMLDGTYVVQLVTLLEGRVLDPLRQDVFPQGIKEIGVLEAGADGEHLFDLSVRRVQGQIDLDGVEQPTGIYHTAKLRLMSEGLEHPIWAELSNGGRFDLLLYEGNYEAELALQSNRGRDTEPYDSIGALGRTWLGPLCVGPP